jgi:hypothetical protein
MKYRIIHEVDGNGNQHYEVQFYERCWFGREWVNTRRQVCDGHFAIKARYPTLELAQEVVNERSIMRTVTEHGVVYERSEV